ncbi:MAG: hypothetical protein ABIH23_21695, partial [bacterium]
RPGVQLLGERGRAVGTAPPTPWNSGGGGTRPTTGQAGGTLDSGYWIKSSTEFRWNDATGDEGRRDG